jgi:hypothetical protein
MLKERALEFVGCLFEHSVHRGDAGLIWQRFVDCPSRLLHIGVKVPVPEAEEDRFR